MTTYTGPLSELSVTVFNNTGFAVYRGTIDNNSQISLTSLGLESGLCLVRVEAGGITEVVRIVVL